MDGEVIFGKNSGRLQGEIQIIETVPSGKTAVDKLQLTNINAFAPSDRPRALTWLSPKQQALEEAGQGVRKGE